jgi:hypothetical protein
MAYEGQRRKCEGDGNDGNGPFFSRSSLALSQGNSNDGYNVGNCEKDPSRVSLIVGR